MTNSQKQKLSNIKSIALSVDNVKMLANKNVSIKYTGKFGCKFERIINPNGKITRTIPLN